ncbi:MAG TPA: c-type cytochrome [Anaerolineae bacterium]
MLDNPNVLFAVTFAAFLGAVIVLGVVGALVARLVTNFIDKNVPDDATMKAFEASRTADITAPRKSLTVSPQAEPFVIAGAGFVVVFMLTSIFITPAAPKAADTGAPKPVAGLPTTGDFTKIVADLPKGNADAGLKLYTSQGCIGCHSLEKDKRLVGPSFYGIWSRAGTRKPNMGGPEYIYESIVAPNAFVVPTYQAGLMPQTFARTLKAQDVADILAWLQRDHNEP